MWCSEGCGLVGHRSRDIGGVEDSVGDDRMEEVWLKDGGGAEWCGERIVVRCGW